MWPRSLSVIESCKRLKQPVREYLALFLPGLGKSFGSARLLKGARYRLCFPILIRFTVSASQFKQLRQRCTVHLGRTLTTKATLVFDTDRPN